MFNLPWTLRKELFVCEHSLVIVRIDEIGLLSNNSFGVYYWVCNNDKAVLCLHKNGNDDKSLLLNSYIIRKYEADNIITISTAAL